MTDFQKPPYLPDVPDQITRYLELLGRRHETQQYLLFKVGTFTRDTATASGSQSVTGVGFKPRALIIHGGVNGAARMSIGWSDGTNGYGMYDNFASVADTYGYLTAGTNMLFFNGGGTDYTGAIASFDSDGFTISWTRTGAPTGTLLLNYLALR